MKLIVTEKPSVAQSIAAVLGATSKKDGYIEGKDCIISWCVGHLVGLSPPEDYNPDYQNWKQSDLPILPEQWRYFIAEKTAKQFAVLKALMNDSRISSLVCATDAGREGELIFRLVYEQAGCRKPFERLWLASMEENAIREGFQNLKDGREYDRLYESALCRAKADWAIGMNATRLYSIGYQTPLHIGRVQTPTLAMLVEREKQIAAFQKTKSYSVSLQFDGFSAQSEAFPTASDAEKIIATCSGERAVVISMERKEKTLNPPKLHDLTTLQRDANRILGSTAQQALDMAQKLYERKYLTYPRTDSQYITEDMQNSALELARLACSLLGYANFEPDVSRLANNAKVQDHHAILPTKQGLEKGTENLTADEKALFLLVVKRLGLASATPYQGEIQAAVIRCGGTMFRAFGEKALHLGFTALETSEIKAKPLPMLEADQVLSVHAAHVEEHETTPPKHYTEDTLLSAMERAGKEDLDDSLDTEKSGLGTPATRAGFIEKLIKSGYAIRSGKQILPTDRGVQLIAVAPEALRSPRMTAAWENELTKIAMGLSQPDQFMESIEDFVKEMVSDGLREPMDASLFQQEVESIGSCPRCGKSVLERRKGFFCEDRACGFAMWKDDLFFKSKKKALTKAVAATLLKMGKVTMKGLYSEKTGKKYDAAILLDASEGKYVRYKLEFTK